MSRRLELKPSEVLSKQNNPVTLIEFIHREGFFPPSDYTEIKHTTFTPPPSLSKCIIAVVCALVTKLTHSNTHFSVLNIRRDIWDEIIAGKCL